ncbi:MAG: ABC-type multidrug transport system, permease component [Chloroflexi bacterium]|jgi:ABC-2 type transport system permease protein|nr:MAG: ABC-type multidrug transport system, permease component [Chloroflexota bacterium]
MGSLLKQSLVLAGKDMKVFFKDRFAVVFALAFPVMFILAFSLALSGVGLEDDKLILTVATQEPPGGLSHRLIEGMEVSTDVTIRVLSYEEALQSVEKERLGGFVSFPADFSQRLLSGQATQLEVFAHVDQPSTRLALEGLARAISSRLTNGQAALTAVIGLRAMEGRQLSAEDMAALLAIAGQEPPVAFVVERIGDIKDFNAGDFTMPGYLTMFVFFAAALSAEAIAKERQNHTLERLMANGVRRESVVLGKFFGATYKGLIQLAVLWSVGVLAFNVDLGVSPVATILLSVLMVLASAGFGILLASFVRTVRAASSAGVLSALVLAPIGGSWWPLFIAPPFMQFLAKLTPHGWANAGFNKLMLFGADFGDVLWEMTALLAFGLAFLAVALLKFRMAPSG